MTRTAFKTQKRRAPMPPWTPEGWRLVPEKPTEEWIAELRRHTSYASTGKAIELMLKCAPKFEEQKHGEESKT
jgi:hypothetical protein